LAGLEAGREDEEEDISGRFVLFPSKIHLEMKKSRIAKRTLPLYNFEQAQQN
jgi:hypothetical protein